MREYQVKGMMELKAEYEEQLAGIAEYQALSTEFHDKALTLAREAVTASGLSLADAPMLEAVTRLRGRESARCGFCTNCITDCRTCICRQPGD